MTTSRANQVAIGGASNTYTLAGVGSDASRAAQSGPTQVLTTDAAGNIAGDGGALNSRLDGFADDIDEANAGIALSLALDAPSVPIGHKFALGGGVAVFGGEGAVAASFTARVNTNVQINVGVGSGFRGNSVGGRAGAVYSW